MRHLPKLVLHELRMLLISPATYITAVLFLALMGLLYFWNIMQLTQTASSDMPTEAFFRGFWLPVLFMVPLLTMRSLAEERRLGTIETLLTTPVSPLEIVLSKFLGAYLFYIFLWLLTLSFPFIVNHLQPATAQQAHLMDSTALTGGLLYIAISGTLYIAVGIFSSCLTRSLLVAGMLTFCLLFLLIVSGQIIEFLPYEDSEFVTSISSVFNYLRTMEHLEDFSTGVIDTRPFFLYLSSAFLLLGITTFITQSKA